MPNFIIDGTSLPYPKVDLVPLGTAPANKYVASADWNTACQAMVDVQGFLRGGFQLFKSDDPSVKVPLLVLQGAPLISAAKGSLALDVTGPALYQNTDGASTWTPFATGTGMSIGGAVSGSTDGSALFIGTGGVLAQNNTRYFWDNTNSRLGVGTSAPGTTLDIASASTVAGLAMRAGSTTAVSAANTGRIRYDESTQKFQASLNGAAYVDFQTGAGYTLAVGNAIGSSTVGSVLFVGAGNVLGQDSAKLFWDDTNDRLGIGTATPATTLDLVSAGNATAIAMAPGSTAGISVGSTARVRFNESTNKLQVSLAGGAYADIATGAAGMSIGGSISGSTVGSVLFVGAGGVLQQDNANFFWDDTNNALVLGAAGLTKTGFSHEFTKNAATVVTASSYGTGLNAEYMVFRGRGIGGATTAVQSGDVLGAFSMAGATTATAVLSGAYMRGLATENWSGTAAGTQIQFFTTANTTVTRTLRVVIDQNGYVGLGASTPGTTLDIADATTAAGLAMRAGSTTAVSAANTGRIRYNESSQKFQASQNTSAYFDLALNATTLVSGAVLFGSPTGTITQDSANLFWDNTNKRLGIGTATPSSALHVQTSSISLIERTSTDTSNVFGALSIQHTTTGNMAAGFGPSLLFRVQDDTSGSLPIAYVGAARGSADTEGDLVFAPYLGGNPVERMRLSSTGQLWLGDTTTTLVESNVDIVTIGNAGTGQTADSKALLRLSNTGSYNTTAAQISTMGIVSTVTATRSAGANSLNNYAAWLSASGAQVNRALITDAGDVYLNASSGTTGIGAQPGSEKLTVAMAGAANTIAATYTGTAQTADRAVVNAVNSGTFDATAAVRIAYGIIGSSNATRSAGANSVINRGVYANASGAQVNQAILADAGDVYLNASSGTTGIGTAPDPAYMLGVAGGDVGFFAASLFVTGGANIDCAGIIKTDTLQHHTSPGGTTPITIQVPIDVVGDLSTFGGSGHTQIVYINAIAGSGRGFGFGYNTNATETGYINWHGYQAGATQFRDLIIGDGKTNAVATFTGSTKALAVAGGLSSAGATSVVTGGSALFQYGTAGGNIYFSDVAGYATINAAYGNNSTASLWINSQGYQDGVTQFRDTVIGDGKQNAIVTCTGSTKTTLLSGLYNQKVHANFAGSEAQATTAAVQTTNATQTTLFSFTLADNKVYRFEAEVIARDEAGTERALYGKIVLVYRQSAGTATIQGSVQDIHPDVETSAGLDVTWTVSSNDVRLSVTGLAATTIDWVTEIRYQAVATNA